MIKLLDYRVVQLRFNPSTELMEYLSRLQDDNEKIPEIKYEALFPEDEENEFYVHFKIKLTANEEDDGYFLSNFLARFSINDAINDEFKNSHFPKVNAPAIAYPFFRAFVNNFFTNSGYDSVLLPTYNFTKSVHNKSD